MKNNASRGLILYLIAIAAVVMLIVTVSNKWQLKDAYNYKKFSSDLKDNKIESIEITPNAETPTGVVAVTMKDDGKIEYLYVSDISVIEEKLKDEFFLYFFL